MTAELVGGGVTLLLAMVGGAIHFGMFLAKNRQYEADIAEIKDGLLEVRKWAHDKFGSITPMLTEIQIDIARLVTLEEARRDGG